MGFPSSQPASAIAGAPFAPAHPDPKVLAESISSVVGFCGFAAILFGESSVGTAQQRRMATGTWRHEAWKIVIVGAYTADHC